MNSANSANSVAVLKGLEIGGIGARAAGAVATVSPLARLATASRARKPEAGSFAATGFAARAGAGFAGVAGGPIRADFFFAAGAVFVPESGSPPVDRGEGNGTTEPPEPPDGGRREFGRPFFAAARKSKAPLAHHNTFL
jgi:hypothetical protein